MTAPSPRRNAVLDVLDSQCPANEEAEGIVEPPAILADMMEMYTPLVMRAKKKQIASDTAIKSPKSLNIFCMACPKFLRDLSNCLLGPLGTSLLFLTQCGY